MLETLAKLLLSELAALELKADSEADTEVLAKTEVIILCSTEVGSLILANSEADICSTSSSDCETDALAAETTLLLVEFSIEAVSDESSLVLVIEPTLVLMLVVF